MKSLVCISLLLISILLVEYSYAKDPMYITLPNNQTLDISNLSNEEISRAVILAKNVILAKKSISNSGGITADAFTSLDPVKLDEWRKLITGTIKDICNDLNVAVNEFVKTPVGIGIAGLIIYKTIGHDILENAISFIIMIPLWSLVTITCLVFTWYYFGQKTIYIEEYDNITGKLITKKPSTICRYPWDTRSDSKGTFAWFIFLSWLLTTIVSLIVLLA